MRTFDNGNGFTVSFNEEDAYQFSRRWPCSTVAGSGSFSFADNGDLIDATGAAETGDGSDWLAFSFDCQSYGDKRIATRRARLV